MKLRPQIYSHSEITNGATCESSRLISHIQPRLLFHGFARKVLAYCTINSSFETQLKFCAADAPEALFRRSGGWALAVIFCSLAALDAGNKRG